MRDNGPVHSAERPTVSVAILCHDEARHLPVTLASVRAQMYGALERLALDNCSTDGSSALLRAADVKVLTETRLVGYGAAKNRLVEEARGEYVLLLDDDVELPDRDTVAQCLRFSQQHDDACIVSIVLAESGSAATDHYGLFFTPTKRPVAPDVLRTVPPYRAAAPVGACIFFRRSLFLALGGFDELYPRNLDDYDLGARAALQGIDVWMLTRVAGVHRGRHRRRSARAWEWSQSYYLCGMMRTLAKTCRPAAAALWMAGAAMWIVWSGLRHVRSRGLAAVCRATAISAGRACRDLPSTLACRRRIQSSRVRVGDEFLTLLPPAPCLNTVGRMLHAVRRWRRGPLTGVEHADRRVSPSRNPS